MHMIKTYFPGLSVSPCNILTSLHEETQVYKNFWFIQRSVIIQQFKEINKYS